MKIITAPRRGGKTYQLIQEMRKDPRAFMLQPTAVMADRIVREYPELRGRIWTAQREDRDVLRGMHAKYYLDNLDMVLWDLLGVRVDTATATGASMHLPYVDPAMRVNEGL